MAFRVPDQFRVTRGRLGTERGSGNNGAFVLPAPPRSLSNARLHCIATDNFGWEHVSVTLSAPRIPTWAEMCYVKSVFWEPEDTVLQIHPAESEYVDLHPHCLHLWRPIGTSFPVPPTFLV